jgi:hypothetical protein
LLENMVTYLSYGLTDIDECESETYKHRCKTKANCKNIDGNHTCVCPKGYSGDGTKDQGCQPPANLIVLYTVLGKQLGIHNWYYIK